MKVTLAMFTGLVEAMGTVQLRQPEGPGCRLRIAAPILTEGTKIGDSIAVNGCCLTVVACSGSSCEFQAGAETLQRTNLGRLQPGDRVNLERSLRVGDRMGGHFVTGHIDGVGAVAQRMDDADWSLFWFAVPPELARYLAPKGSIAVDGVSLTVVDVKDHQFSVALIPHTLQQTLLGQYRVDQPVNLETDLLAKYVLRNSADA